MIHFISIFLSVFGTSLSHSAHLGPELSPIQSSYRMDWSSNPPADIGFCSKWNPDYGWYGQNCCPAAATPRRRRANRCAPKRQVWSKCGDRRRSQVEYEKAVQQGKYKNLLETIVDDMQTDGRQAYCIPSGGFLVNGRPVVGTPQNQIIVKHTDRCHYFGTDGAVGLLEWLGHEVRRGYYQSQFSGARIVVGDLSSPRGGCVSGGRSRRAHFSHTNGQDIDLGFLNIYPGRISPEKFDRRFDTAINAWLIKKILRNPVVCVKVILLDRRLIAKVNKKLANDPEWPSLSRFIQHARGHHNHFHIRVGLKAGKPGCGPDARPEDEFEEDDMGEEEVVEGADSATDAGDASGEGE